MSTPCRDEDAAEAPVKADGQSPRVSRGGVLHPDIYALLARWMLEDMRKRQDAGGEVVT